MSATKESRPCPQCGESDLAGWSFLRLIVNTLDGKTLSESDHDARFYCNRCQLDISTDAFNDAWEEITTKQADAYRQEPESDPNDPTNA